jgi:microcin C transport system permease protein
VLAYAVRRLLLIVPTLVGIMVVNFIVVQAAPGGPVEQVIAQIRGQAVDATARLGGSAAGETGGARAVRAASTPS